MLHKPRLALMLSALFFLPSSPAAAAFLLPDDAVIEVKSFSFPENAGKSLGTSLPDVFRVQLVLALENAGFTVLHEDPAHASAMPEPVVTPPSAPLTVTPLPEEENDGTDREENLAAEDDPAPDDAAPEEPAAPSLPETRAPRATHVLGGTVTLFRESVGAPARIGGNIRIRVESLIHCTYKITDAASGNVLISDVSSGSAARITGEKQDIDAVLQTLSTRAMTTAAETMAAHLAGKDLPGDGTMSDKAYYQDSPGKRLKKAP